MIFLFTSLSLSLLWYMCWKPSSIPPLPPSWESTVPPEKMINGSTVPPKKINIRSWIENELVTIVQPQVKANCQLLKAGNRTEQERVVSELKTWTNRETIDEFYTKAQRCSYVRNLLSSDNFYISDTERNFSIAYSIVFHNSPQQIMRLLRVIYRPHNVYCLNPDRKANKTLIQVFRKLASCFDNIVVPDNLVDVTYLHISTVDAHLTCFHYLNASTIQWRYANILCGKELPFSSNRVMVDTLKKLNGDSLVNAYRLPDKDFKKRLTSHYRAVNGTMQKLGPRTEKAPFTLELYKSVIYLSASRQFVDFLLTSTRVRALYQYMSTALMPDEEFFATAYMLPEAPTAHRPGFKLILAKAFFSLHHPKKECAGKSVHTSCILNVRDIPLLHEYNLSGKRTVFFYNKYFMEYDHVVMDCMEQRIVEQNKLEYERDCYSS